MNLNTSKWAVKIGTPETSEAVQRIAFSFDYKWPIDGKLVKQTHSRFLVFDPNDKSITWVSEQDRIETFVHKIVFDFDSVVMTFTNPPQANLQVGSNISVSKNGNVTVGTGSSTLIIGSDLFDKAVAERDLFLGRNEAVESKPDIGRNEAVESKPDIGRNEAVESKPEKKPLAQVQFIYKNRLTPSNKLRTILVVMAGDDFLSGYDYSDAFRFKKFLKSKIEGPINFLGFAEVP